MKAITLYQPWATLIAIGAKKYETRSWATNYRGPIAIHAGLKNPLHTTYINQLLEIGKCLQIACNDEDVFRKIMPALENLPLGAIIATAELIECWRIVNHPGTDVDIAKKIDVGAELDVPKHHPRFHDYIVPTEQEQLFGDWTPERYAWELANLKMLPKPIPAKGRLRLWEWEGTNE